MSSSLSISERPSIPISLARSCNSSLVSSSYSDVLPPRLPASERPVFAILAAFSLLAPSSRSFSYCSLSLMLGPWSLAICPPFNYSRSLYRQVEKVHPQDGRLSLETIHATKRRRSRLARPAGRPSMNLGDGSRATAPASEHGPSSINITSREVLRRVSHPHSQAPSHQRYISASPSPEKTGKVLPSSRVNTSRWSLSFLVISHHGEPGGLSAHPCAFSYNTSDPSLPIRRPVPWCMRTSCPLSARGKSFVTLW